MSNTSISASITSDTIGYLQSENNLQPGVFTPTFWNWPGLASNVDVSIDNDNIGGFTDGVNADNYSMVTFPSTMSKARLTLPDLTIDSQSTWIGADIFLDPGIYLQGFNASVVLDFRLLVIDGDNTELANVSYGTETFRISESGFSSSIGFNDPTISPATSTVDITLGSNKNISFKLYADDTSTSGRVFGYYF